MSEMLANHHFLVRDYISAAESFEEELRLKKSSINLKKKLIICYTQIGKADKALDIVISLNSDEFESIINTNPQIEDCPCRDLINKIEKRSVFNPDLRNKYLVLGILWLYCDIRKSVEFLDLVQKLAKSDKRVNYIIKILESKINPNPTNIFT